MILTLKGFPKCISCSVNNVAAHGIPDNRKLEKGDIVNIDVTVFLDGYHGDCSFTYPVGQIDQQAEKLIKVTSECLGKGYNYIFVNGEKFIFLNLFSIF